LWLSNALDGGFVLAFCPLLPPAGGGWEGGGKCLPLAAMHYPYLAYCIACVPKRVGGVMTGVLPSRELGARASGAHGAGISAGGRSQAQASAPGGIHKRPGQMNEHNVYPIRKLWITRLPSPHPPPLCITHTWYQPRVYSRDDRYGCCCG